MERLLASAADDHRKLRFLYTFQPPNGTASSVLFKNFNSQIESLMKLDRSTVAILEGGGGWLRYFVIFENGAKNENKLRL